MSTWIAWVFGSLFCHVKSCVFEWVQKAFLSWPTSSRCDDLPFWLRISCLDVTISFPASGWWYSWTLCEFRRVAIFSSMSEEALCLSINALWSESPCRSRRSNNSPGYLTNIPSKTFSNLVVPICFPDLHHWDVTHQKHQRTEPIGSMLTKPIIEFSSAIFSERFIEHIFGLQKLFQCDNIWTRQIVISLWWFGNEKYCKLSYDLLRIILLLLLNLILVRAFVVFYDIDVQKWSEVWDTVYSNSRNIYSLVPFWRTWRNN